MQGLGNLPLPNFCPSIQFISHLHSSKICSRPPSLLHSSTNELEIIKICMICGLLASRTPQAPQLLPWHWGGMRPEDKAEPRIVKISCVSWRWRICWRAHVAWTSQNPTRLNQRHHRGASSLPGTSEGFQHFDCIPHRMTEYLHLEELQKDHRLQLPAQTHQWRKLNNHMWRDKIESRFTRNCLCQGKKKNPAKNIFAHPWIIQTMKRSCQMFHMADATRGFDCLEKGQCYDQASKTCVWSEQQHLWLSKANSLYQAGTGLQRGCQHPCPPGLLRWQPLVGGDVKLKKEK